MALIVTSAFGVSPQIEPEFSASFAPVKLSRSEQTPVSLHAAMRFKTSDGTPPPALQEFEIDEDRHAVLDLKDVPVCPRGTVESPPPQQRCKDAVIGNGKMTVNIHFPEAEPMETKSELTVFNSGLRKDVRNLLIVGYLEVPTSAEIVISASVRRSKPGHFKLKLVGLIPKIAGGSGSVTYLGLQFRKGIFSARCEDRRLETGLGAKFIDGSFLTGKVLTSCTPLP
ncbi:MAG: hypothetical protein ACTHN3_13615 [Solirubrobacterales bacterium]